MSAEKPSVSPGGDGSVVVRTPANFYITPQALPEVTRKLAPMAGGQDGEPTNCPFTAHQLVCVSGEVTTTVGATCTTRVVCLGGGVGTTQCPTGSPPPCSFKFFENLCVEVDVNFAADATCTLNQVQCLGAEAGPCPTPNG